MENENVDFLTVMLKYGVLLMLIMAIIFVLAVLTPWMATQVDKIIARIKKKEDPAQNAVDPRCAQVKGIYDASEDLPESPQADAQTLADGDAAPDTTDTKEEE